MLLLSRDYSRWYSLSSKTSSTAAIRNTPQFEQYRGELELVISFAVKSLSSSQQDGLNLTQRQTSSSSSAAFKSTLSHLGDKVFSGRRSDVVVKMRNPTNSRQSKTLQRVSLFFINLIIFISIRPTNKVLTMF